VATNLLPEHSKSDQRLHDYSQMEQRLPAYGRTELQMPKMSKGDSRSPAYPRRETPMLEPMVDILTGDYYHLELAKKPQGIPDHGMTAAFDGWPFSSKRPAKPMLDSRVPDRSGPSPSGRASFPRSHRLVYPLGPSHPVAPPLMDRTILPLTVPARKPLSYKMYKEGVDPDAYTRSFEKILWVNGETDEWVMMTLFCTTLTDKVQRWADDYLDMHPNCTWKQFKATFKKRYREEQTDEQVYVALKTLKQGDNEGVEDYYERFMKLIRCLQTIVGEGFMLSNFRIGLLDYLRIITSVLNIASVTELKEAAQKCEDNFIDAHGRKVKLDIQRIVPISSRSGSTIQKEQGGDTNKRPYCNKCQRYGHEEARYWGTPPNSKNAPLASEKKGIVGVNEVHLHPVPGTGQSQPQQGSQRPSQDRDSGHNPVSTPGANNRCYRCGDPIHPGGVNQVHLQPVAGASPARSQQGGQQPYQGRDSG
jgi:hypothetical protein